MVRTARQGDLSAVCRYLKGKHPSTTWARWPFSAPALRKNLSRLIGKMDWCILISETECCVKGVLVGCVDELLFSRTRYATDVLFAADQEASELMDGFKQWAKAREVKFFLMGVTDTDRAQAKDRWYQMKGFERVGGMYMEIIQ